MKKFLSIAHKSLTELGAENYQDLWKKAQDEGYEGISVCVPVALTKGGDNKFHAVFSTDSEDRHGDIVRQEFDLKAFKKNPVFLDSHNYDSIEHIIGRVNGISSKTGSLEGDIEFFLDNPKGLLAFKAAEQGFLNTTSIGFIPKEFSDKGEILKSELLEISAVSVPANAEALFEKKEEGEEVETKEVEPAVEPTEASPAIKVTMKPSVAKVVARINDEDKRQLKALAKAVQELVNENKVEKKRKIFQIIRSLTSE
jgi:phage head maturation protease